jgi:hypothetical protein
LALKEAVIEDMDPEISERGGLGGSLNSIVETVLFEDLGVSEIAILEHTVAFGL